MVTGSTKGEILIIEDEPDISGLVAMYLQQEGYRVTQAVTGEDGLRSSDARPPTLVILDIALPGIDGLEVCRRLRAQGSVPILMLTARDGETDKVLGLEMGADDYLTKPFSPRELVARVKAILRRTDPEPTEAGPLGAGETTIWPDRREVTAGGVAVELTAKEFDLVAYLIKHRGIALSRRQILGAVWEYDFYGGERTVDTHIRAIRQKLGRHLPLRTVRGVGYKVERER